MNMKINKKENKEKRKSINSKAVFLIPIKMLNSSKTALKNEKTPYIHINYDKSN